MSATRKRLLENTTALLILQGANYLLPLVTLPYLFRVLGVEMFGLVAFAHAFIQYFVLLTDYGFNLSATREIAIHKGDWDRVSKIFSAVMVVRIGLLLASFFVMALVVGVIPKFTANWQIYYVTFLMVIGYALFPVWFFQGIERMKYITILQLIAKLIFTVMIFVVVRTEGDYLYVPLFNSIGFFVAGVIALIVVHRTHRVSIAIPSMDEVMEQAKKGWHIFLSTVAVSAYTNTRIFAVGLLTNNTVTGYYTLAEKLMQIIKMFPLASVLQSVYPWLNGVYSQNRNRARALTKIFQNYTTIGHLILLPIIYIFAPTIVKLASGAAYSESVLAFRLLLIAVFFTNSNAFRVHYLLISGRDSQYSKIHIVAALAGIVLLFALCHLFSYVGVAISMIVIEFSVMLWTMWTFSKEEEVATTPLEAAS